MAHLISNMNVRKCKMSGTIGVMDYDFFNYNNVIPNLECAKLVAYYRNHNHIAVLSPVLRPDRFNKFFVRKEYNDGIFP